MCHGRSPTWIMLRGSHGNVSGFQTTATCRDGSREKSATSPFVAGKAEIGDVRDKTRGSRRRRGQMNGDVTGLSRTSRGSRHSGIWA